MTDMIMEIDNLVAQLNAASEAYYSGAAEIMSDREWDKLFDRLSDLEQSTGYVPMNSPTHRVGIDTKEANGEIEPHEFPAKSLDKTKDIGRLQQWARDKKIWLSWKLDGLTLVLTYHDGKLVKILTRGNGIEGTNITFVKDAISGFPKEIPVKGHVVVRGEATISYSDFERINAELPDGREPYDNPRNLASGTMAIDHSRLSIIKSRNVCFHAFTLVDCPNNYVCRSWGNRMDWLEMLGFDVVERECGYAKDLPEMVARWTKKVEDGKMDIPVDGLVITYDDTVFAATFTQTSHHDNGAGLAFKWPDEEAETTLRGIEWSCGTTCITPVAIFDPVQLEGTTVRRASLHNISEMKRLGIGSSRDTILVVYKANKIIPQVSSADGHGTVFDIPDTCPVCGWKTEHRKNAEGVETLHCTNPACAAKNLKKFVRFVSKDGVNVDGLSSKKIADLIAGGFVSSVIDLYSLEKEYENTGCIRSRTGDILSDRDGWGEISIQNLCHSIRKSRMTDMRHVLYSLSIPMCGHHVAKLLLARWSVSDLLDMIASDLDRLYVQMCGIDGIGVKKAQAFVNWFRDADNIVLFECLLSEVRIKDNAVTAVKQTCVGYTFAITGSVHTFQNRDEFKQYVEQHGGRVSSSVSKKTSYLVSNEPSTSSKSVKAASFGVPVITEDEFLLKF